MSTKTKKRLWLYALLVVLGIVAVLVSVAIVMAPSPRDVVTSPVTEPVEWTPPVATSTPVKDIPVITSTTTTVAEPKVDPVVAYSDARQKILDELNAERAAEGLVLLKRSVLLDEAAQLKAEDMIAKDYFAHESPEGWNSWYWFKQVNYAFTEAGENLARNYSPDQVVAAWMASPTHKVNVLKAEFREVGLAVKDEFIVAEFAAPRL